MDALSYSFRRHGFSLEKHYALRVDALEWRDKHGEGRIPYHDVSEVRIFKERFLGAAATYWTCVFRTRQGAQIRLGAANRTGLRAIEDCTAAYMPFVKELEARIKAANPNAAFIAGRHWLSRIEIFAGRTAVQIAHGMRILGPDLGGAVIAFLMRSVGPRLRGHRTARANLAAAFPEKSGAEIERVLFGMWDNLGRSLAEYAWLDQLWDFEPDSPSKVGRIAADQGTIALYRRFATEKTPCIFFAAHIGNWELPALSVPAAGREGAMLFRPPKIEPLAEELYSIRNKCMGTVIPADQFALFRLSEAIQRGAIVGILADQHFAGGVDVVFFGRQCKVNPLIARLARTFECPIYGARDIRIGGCCFRHEITPALDLPRDAHGRVDVVGTMQIITSIIEGWVREFPEQWMWLHRRWR